MPGLHLIQRLNCWRNLVHGTRPGLPVALQQVRASLVQPCSRDRARVTSCTKQQLRVQVQALNPLRRSRIQPTLPPPKVAILKYLTGSTPVGLDCLTVWQFCYHCLFDMVLAKPARDSVCDLTLLNK